MNYWLNVDLILLNTLAHSIGILTVRAMEYCVPASCSVCFLGGRVGGVWGGTMRERAAICKPVVGRSRDMMHLCYM